MSSTTTTGELLNNSIQLANRAIGFEREANYRVAIYFYHEAFSELQRAIEEAKSTTSNSTNTNIEGQIQKWIIKGQEFLERISLLQQAIEDAAAKEERQTKKKSPEEILLEKAKFLIDQALKEDEGGDEKEAIELYTKAVEFCIQSTKQKGIPQSISSKLNGLARQSLERAEELKGISAIPTETIPIGTLNLDDSKPKSPNLVNQRRNANSEAYFPKSKPNASNAAGPSNSSGTSYTQEEKLVLQTTSRINGIEYMPFLPNVDLLHEKFNFTFNFTDPNGLLKLSPKQKSNLKEWLRPSEIFAEPCMIQSISSYSIKQTLVSDCSFVASLAISANYERRFGKKLIRNIIYPQNKNGEPVVNPFGKYMVLLRINGVKRKVIIDDLLPVGRHHELLCSYTSKKGELWVSLLEKAYMKVMGGYDFPGSNSNIDLHALTGWIPERQSIGSDQNPDKTFYMLMNKMNEGKVLATVATGEMSEREADRAGLVPTHAYALLDIREVKDDDGRSVKLLLVKNPWSHLRWKGNWSELDVKHWTPRMKKLLEYDPDSAQIHDNGVFWIDYESLRKFFDVFYMNWDPHIFSYSYSTHRSWCSTSGPIKDVYTISSNPQYSLEVDCEGNKGGVVWVLLTRHITDIIDFKDNREYITVLVYENDGRKVYYPYDPPPLIDGVRINSPHYLCKIIVPSELRSKRYTLVVSQYEKTTTIHYTLRVYSSVKFRVGEILNNCEYKKELKGNWTDKNAGGCANFPATHMNNPTYRLELKRDGKLIVDLKAPKEFNVGFDVICANSTAKVQNTEGPGSGFFKKSTGPYRPGFVVLDIPHAPAGIYNIVPSTFDPGQKGPFLLHIQSSSPFDVHSIQ